MASTNNRAPINSKFRVRRQAWRNPSDSVSHDQALLEKILRIAVATRHFDWVAVSKLVIKCAQDGKATDLNTVFRICTERVLISQLDRDRLARSKMPQELWDTVNKFLPSLTGSYASTALGFALTTRPKRHSDIWSNIFKEGASWNSLATDRPHLNLALLGDDLRSLWDDLKVPAFLALVKANKRFPTQAFKEKLLDSFQAHDLENGGRQVVFRESRITLNVESVLDDRGDILCEPTKLVSYQDQGWRSACLYWEDGEQALRTIGPEDIVGLKMQGPSLHDVSHICGITLTHPKEMRLKGRQQHIFVHDQCPECAELYHISAPGRQYDGDNQLGWERKHGIAA